MSIRFLFYLLNKCPENVIYTNLSAFYHFYHATFPAENKRKLQPLKVKILFLTLEKKIKDEMYSDII